jgi:hypothetical protein
MQLAGGELVHCRRRQAQQSAEASVHVLAQELIRMIPAPEQQAIVPVIRDIRRVRVTADGRPSSAVLLPPLRFEISLEIRRGRSRASSCVQAASRCRTGRLIAWRRADGRFIAQDTPTSTLVLRAGGRLLRAPPWVEIIESTWTGNRRHRCRFCLTLSRSRRN